MTFTQKAVEAAARAMWPDFDNMPAAAKAEVLAEAERCLTAALAVDGLCLVPKESTEEMREAGAEFSAVCCAETGCIVGEVYRAMLAAANDGEERPSPPEGKI
jgi:hypothetical protein